MKKAIIKVAMSHHFVMAALGVTLVVSAVSCKTTATPDKPAGLADRSRTAAAKPVFSGYYTCGMHPEVRSLDPDGKCPICNMPLLPAETIEVVDPVSGKTNTAATFPAVSGYYSCPLHPTVLSDDPDGKCPICNRPLLPVENLIFRREK
jgi:hypothetical protein